MHVDPASPVAKEYALPLATARGAPPESGQTGKLFGSGIEHAAPPAEQATTVAAPRPASPPNTTGTVTTPAAHRHPAHNRGPMHVTVVTLPTLTQPKSRHQNARATPAAYRVLRPGSGSSLLWMALAAVVVIALGSAGGLALRRRP